MRHALPSGILLLAAMLAAGCTDISAPTETADLAPLFAKPGGGGTTSNPKLQYTFADRDGDAIRSDNRAESGVVGQYTDGVCGVFGEFAVGANGGTGTDAVLDPDKSYRKGSCGPRQIQFVLPSGTASDGSYVTIANIYGMVEGGSERRRMAFTTSSATGCGSIRFGHTSGQESEGVIITRLSATQWVVQTDESSIAECWVNGSAQQEQPMPFSLTLTVLP